MMTDDSSTESPRPTAPELPVNKLNFQNAIHKVAVEYSSRSSIHGLQYLAERRPLHEKWFWLLVYIVTIYFLFFEIWDVYNKWRDTPVIVSFAEKPTPVYSIPFPAVTICSETKYLFKPNGKMQFGPLLEMVTKKSEHHQLLEQLAEMEQTDVEEFLTLLQICQPFAVEEGLPRLYNNTFNFFEVLDRMAPPFMQLHNTCKWNTNFANCNELLTKTYTEDGICYTFNGLNTTDLYREDTVQYSVDLRYNGHFRHNEESLMSRINLKWTMETGYKRTGIHTYPARALGSGTQAGLFVALESKRSELDFKCRGPVQGFKVVLHAPNDVPRVSKHYVHVSMDKEISLIVKPNLIVTTKGVSNYQTKYRHCYLSHERKLRFFKIYTQSNCELECLSNFTYDQCGCVMFSMPRTHSMAVCNEQQIHCFYHSQSDILLREFHENMFGKKSETDKHYHHLCNCLPTCTSLTYNKEFSQANFFLQDLLKAYNVENSANSNFDDLQLSRLSVYFIDNQFISARRSELYDVTDFLANCGGIFGLFIGFSLISLVEIIYYGTLRLWSQLNSKTK